MLGYSRCPCRELEELRATKRENKELKADLLRVSRLNETLRSANIALMQESRELKAEHEYLTVSTEGFLAAARCMDILGDFINMELVRENPPEELVTEYEHFSMLREQAEALAERILLKQ